MSSLIARSGESLGFDKPSSQGQSTDDLATATENFEQILALNHVHNSSFVVLFLPKDCSKLIWRTIKFAFDNYLNNGTGDVNSNNNETWDYLMSPNADYKLKGYELFKPKYLGYSTLKPSPSKQIENETSTVLGSLLLLKNDKGTKLLDIADSILDEGKTLSRIQVDVSSLSYTCGASRDALLFFPVYTYIWNGNSLIGEYEYM